MNERIKLLAEQAVEETQLLMIMEYKNFESKLYEKFAELIVRECADIFDKDEMELTLTERGIHYTIKEHFGVEA